MISMKCNLNLRGKNQSFAYRFFVLKNVVGGNWGRFCEEYYAVLADVDDKIKSPEDLNAFLKPYDDQLVENDLTILQRMEVIADRRRSATKQRAFLDECSTFTFADTKSEFIASKILPHLKSISTLKRVT